MGDQVKAVSRSEKRGPGGGLALPAFLKAMGQITEALEEFHARGILFGDLKPDNLLIDPESRRIVFADFGDARWVSEQNIKCVDPHSMGWGNPQYHAKPDVIAKRLSVKSDMWMLAQTAAHLWTGLQPATNPVHLQQNIPLRKTLEACLSQNAANRPTATQILSEIRKCLADLQPKPSKQPTSQPMKQQPTAAPKVHKQAKPTARPVSRSSSREAQARPVSRSSSREATSKPREASTEPPRTFGQNINSNVDDDKTQQGEKKRSPIEEVANIFGARSPQPYCGAHQATSTA